MNVTRATSSPSTLTLTPTPTPIMLPKSSLPVAAHAALKEGRRQVDNPCLSGAGPQSRTRRAMNGVPTSSMSMMPYHQMAAALEATQPIQDRLRVQMREQGHTIGDFDVATPVHFRRIAALGGDHRRARVTCTGCGEWAEIIIASGKVLHGDVDSTEDELIEWRSALGIVACGTIARKPVITTRSTSVQRGVAQSICRTMEEAGHRMSAPNLARSAKYRGLIHVADCEDCKARLLVDGDLHIVYASLSPSGEKIVSSTMPLCPARAAAITIAITPSQPFHRPVAREAVIEISREFDGSQIPSQEDF